jgi:CheY-like chemotaxis protein
MPTEPNRLLTSHDVGRMLQMDPSSIVKWVNDGLLPAFRTPGGHRRVRAADLLVFLRQHQMYIPPELQGGPRRVLFVENDPKDAATLQRALVREGLEPERALSNIEALVSIGAKQPDVLITDWESPGPSALGIIERLKSRPETKDIVIIVAASNLRNSEADKARAAGAKAVIQKPIGIAELRAAIAD